MRTRPFPVCILILGILVAACSEEKGTRTVGLTSNEVTLTGVITYKDDQVPADGGVTLKMELDGGGTETLILGSLFTYPPPSQETLALYEVIVKVNLGDRVVASGQRGDHGIALSDLRVLDKE